MAELASGVYDLVYRSPIPLTELSAISVAIELWRLDLKRYLENGDSKKEFYRDGDKEPRITLRDVIPNIPSTINKITTLYLGSLVNSTNAWLRNIFYDIFRFHRDHRNEILKHFDDIVCDYNGTIHHVRTAKRMMLCDQITQEEKFKIASKYSFEKDIRQIWPSVQAKVDLDEIDFFECPHLYYWVCYLEDKIGKIPNVEDIPVEDLMLENTLPENRSSFEYFWNRAELERRYNVVTRLLSPLYLSPFYARFILPKLSKTQLTKFLTDERIYLIDFLRTADVEGEIPKRAEVILAVWMYIKDEINEANFVRLIERMLRDETTYNNIIHDIFTDEKKDLNEPFKNEYLLTCCEIWISASDNLKRSAIKQLLPDKSLFKKPERYNWEAREVRFLSTVLLDATLKERYDFWITNWLNLLYSTRAIDLHAIMKMCFENEDDVGGFKKNTMAKYENISELVTSYFRECYFDELDEVLKFICSNDEQSRRDLKQKCLRMNFLVENSILNTNILRNSELLHGFIEEAYNYNAEMVINFRNQFLSENVNQLLKLLLVKGRYHWITLFLQSFESRGHNMELLKKRFVDTFRECLFVDELDNSNVHNLREFLAWCLRGEDAMIEFKLSVPADKVLHGMLEKKKSMSGNQDLADGLFDYPRCLDGFLLWYFDQSSEKIDEFRFKFAYVFKMFKPPRALIINT